jgi:hypothetical protein
MEEIERFQVYVENCPSLFLSDGSALTWSYLEHLGYNLFDSVIEFPDLVIPELRLESVNVSGTLTYQAYCQLMALGSFGCDGTLATPRH